MADEISQIYVMVPVSNPADLKVYQQFVYVVGPPLTIAPPPLGRIQFWIET